MAVQVDSPGQLQDFLAILKKRKWQVLLPLAYALALGGAFAVLVPKKYKATTQVELRQLLLDGARGEKALSISTLEAENAPQQLQSLTRIRQVVEEELEWPDYLRLSREEQNEYLIDLRKNLTVTVPRSEASSGSTFVTISYSDVNPQRAYRFLRELRSAWIAQVVERDREQIKFEYENLLERHGEEGKLFEQLQAELSKLKAAHDLSPTQPGPGEGQSRNEDPLYDRITGYQERVAELDLEMKEADALVKRLEGELAETQELIPRTELVKGGSFQDQIVKLRMERVQAVNALENGGYRPPHSKYRELQAEIERIDQNLADLEDEVIEAEELQSWVPNPAFTKLKEKLVDARLESSKKHDQHDQLRTVLTRDGDLNRERQEVYRQERELEQKVRESQVRLSELALKLVSKKLHLNIVTGPTGNPFTITQEPVPPARPTEPNPWLIIAFALVGGAALGIGSAVVAEFSKTGFRSPGDLARVMVVPILGVISDIVTQAQVRRRRVQRMTVAISSAVILGGVLFVTWAWAMAPNLLTPGMKDGIEGFRGMFR